MTEPTCAGDGQIVPQASILARRDVNGYVPFKDSLPVDVTTKLHRSTALRCPTYITGRRVRLH